MNISSTIQQLFERGNGIVGVKTLLENGISYYRINALLADAVIVRLKRGVYKWAAKETDELAEVARIVPDGVFCLLSAAFYHGLTTTVPAGHHVAIPDDRKVVLPDYPPIQLYFWNETPYSLGVATAEVEGGSIQIYDLEKTVCDAIRHRNKIGFEVLKEILNNYLDREDRNLNRLHSYSKQLNIFNKVDDFVKILL
ncbi:type IV toxin-antitoxin system AbiEi family antitoxin domain-containing protein [Neolewinella lacunae]|uniref:Type IV toxin-antitoxin system AbiEi family antitoxin domain-containing protein n=1 Tax=Neolewinella lacunae TaxID=1517758 RepID=A0A923PL76_9BACT|nr:type IV toxin-antitoxin system AbiEi family antitoxin domain-containing protein [Neolewinella lacunae]MBC6993721.1 type IV toxin-antitoxin system AbiEi family antitoxin domain-containing protein [Neolewinella lacunae]MDN3635747.1 type IV toxin-antitoxin system AbiEi family antitoxin domain-containing protein [Neolewinella lacunae]